MKVCLLGPTYPFRGGISHYTTLLGRHFRINHEVQFISFKRQYPKWLFPGKTDKDSSANHIDEGNALRILDPCNPFTWIKVIQLICSFKPDLLIIPWWVSFWAPPFWTISLFSKLFSQTKILFLCHNVVEHESTLLDRVLTKIVLRNGDGFMVHSTEDYTNLKRLFPHGKIKKWFHPTYEIFQQVENNSLLELPGLENRDGVLLFFGFVREYKGLKYLIQALPEIITKCDVTLLVVGEFWKDKEYYLKLVKEQGLSSRVTFIDQYIPNEEVGKYFGVADLVVQPYISATGSGIVQIAFAFCKPVIATKVGCLPEIIDDGETGYLVDPENSQQLAAVVKKFFSEKRASEFTGNIRSKKEIFSWDKMVKEIEKLAVQVGVNPENIGKGSIE